MACTIWDYEGEGMDGTLDDSGSERKGWVCHSVVNLVSPDMETVGEVMVSLIKWGTSLAPEVQASWEKLHCTISCRTG